MRTGPLRWHGAELAALRKAYEHKPPNVRVVDLAAAFRTSCVHICRLARLHGWKRRGADRTPLPEIVHRHARLYNKLRTVLGREAALTALAELKP